MRHILSGSRQRELLTLGQEFAEVLVVQPAVEAQVQVDDAMPQAGPDRRGERSAALAWASWNRRASERA